MSLALTNLNSALSLLRTGAGSNASTGGAAGGAAGVLKAAPLNSPSVAVTRTSNAYVNGLLSGTKWSNPDLTYGFTSTASAYEYSGEAQNNFHALNADQQAAVAKALDAYASVAKVTFTRADGGASATADLRFASSDSPPTAWAYTPTSSPQGGDVWFNYTNGNYADPEVGNYGYDTVLHEIGHALGLKHAHETAGAFPVLPSSHQSMEYTVMSYSSYLGASTRTGYTNQADSYAQSPMMDDIAALQALYGASYATNADDTTYAWDPSTGEMSIDGVAQGAPTSNRVLMTVWDGGGSDTYDFTAYGSNLKVNLSPGKWTTTSTSQLADLKYDGSKKAVGNIANALLYQKDQRSLIENVRGGGGNDAIVGNSANNRLDGGTGNDSLDGGTGNDTLIGGAGADTLIGGTGTDTVNYSGSASGVSLNLANGGTVGDAAGDKYRGIERIVGSAYADNMTGSSVADELNGGDGNDTLAGGAGADTLTGGNGDDVLWGGAGADVLSGGNGHDTFRFAAAAEIGKVAGARDRISDFATAEDTIDLSAIDGNSRTSGRQAFELLASPGAAFTAAGQIRYRYETNPSGGRTIIEVNVDTSLGADFAIELNGHVTGLSRANFVL